MGVQFIKSPGGEDLVLLSRTDYDELVRLANEAQEDAADVAAFDEAMSQPSDALPLEVSQHLLRGAGLLKALRLWRGLSDAQLAERSGMALEEVLDIENQRLKINAELASGLAAALDVPERWLV